MTQLHQFSARLMSPEPAPRSQLLVKLYLGEERGEMATKPAKKQSWGQQIEEQGGIWQPG